MEGVELREPAMSLFGRSTSAPTPDRRSYRFDFSFSTDVDGRAQTSMRGHDARSLGHAVEIIEELQTRCAKAESEAQQADLERCRIAVTATHEISKRDMQIASALRRHAELEDALRAMSARVADMAEALAVKPLIEDRTAARRPPDEAGEPNETVSLHLLRSEIERRDAVIASLSQACGSAQQRVALLQRRLADLEALQSMRGALSLAAGSQTRVA